MTFVAVLDVNVLASAAATGHGTPGRTVDLASSGVFQLAISDHISSKLGEVLRRPYFANRLTAVTALQFTEAVHGCATFVEPDREVTGICDDEEDDLVLGTAVAAKADYLVTGDRGLLAVRSHGEVAIVTARAFLTVLDAR